MKYLIIILVFCSSCSALHRYEKQTVEITRDTIFSTDTLYMRDTLKIHEIAESKKPIMTDTVYRNFLINGLLTTDTVFAFTKYASAYAYVYMNNLYLKLEQDNAEILLKTYRQQITILEKRLENNTKVIEKRIPFYRNICFYTTLFLLLLVFLLVKR